MSESPFNDEVLAEATSDLWEVIEEEMGRVKTWLLDPASKVTRLEMVGKLDGIGRLFLECLLKMVNEQDDRLRDVEDETREKCEEVQGSDNAKIGIREKYAIALRILEDADLTERDLVDVARQADPLAALRKERDRQRHAKLRTP